MCAPKIQRRWKVPLNDNLCELRLLALLRLLLEVHPTRLELCCQCSLLTLSKNLTLKLSYLFKFGEKRALERDDIIHILNACSALLNSLRIMCAGGVKYVLHTVDVAVGSFIVRPLHCLLDCIINKIRIIICEGQIATYLKVCNEGN